MRISFNRLRMSGGCNANKEIVVRKMDGRFSFAICHRSSASKLLSEFLPQLFSFFAQLLFGTRGFQTDRQMFASFVEALQHVIRFGPTGAATRSRFDHLQARFGFGPSRRPFL